LAIGNRILVQREGQDDGSGHEKAESCTFYLMTLIRVRPHNRAQGRVGFQRRRIDSDRAAFQQPLLRHQPQHRFPAYTSSKLKGTESSTRSDGDVASNIGFHQLLTIRSLSVTRAMSCRQTKARPPELDYRREPGPALSGIAPPLNNQNPARPCGLL
jgi:hypothetical protein